MSLSLAVRHALLACAFLVAAPLGAQAAPPAEHAFVVHGRVLGAADGHPLAAVHLIARSTTARLVAETSASGTFRLPMTAARTEQVVLLVALRIGFAAETLALAPHDTAVTIRMRETALTISPTEVRADAPLSAASSRVIRALDIALRPRESAQELLRLVPGLVIAQHAGGGKAEQIFLRGFDADHGTDVAIDVDGTPVNMVSHAHGQGYADLHFLMPEVVEREEVRKGPYDVRDGDLATAGAVTFTTKDRIDAPVASVRGGTFDTEHVLLMLPLGGDAAHGGGYVAGSAHYTNGPFARPQDYRRANGFAKWTTPVLGDAELVASASAFGGRWNGSGEIPARAVREGLITRFGVLDSTEGGNTARYDASLALRSRTASDRAWLLRLYAVRYRFQLFSDFTFALADSVHGDGIEQHDARTVLGGSALYRRAAALLGRPGAWQLGATVRHDDADVGLFHQQGRIRLDTRTLVHERETSVSSWAAYAVQLASTVRIDVGVRGDVFHVDVHDRTPSDGTVHPSGSRWQGVVSPKANLAVDVTTRTTLFVNAGTGFHSNDARDVVLAPAAATVLPRAAAAEVGARHTWNGGTLGASLWGIDLASELVWSGDEGTTEASGRTRRVGVDLEGRVRLCPWLWADADAALARGRFRDAAAGEDRIPLAPTRTLSAGLTMRDAEPAAGGLRVRYVGARAANEDGSVRAHGYTIWELFASYRLAQLRLYGAVDNLFDTAWNEAQFATTSRLPGEPAPVTELHFTPGSPRTLQMGIEYRF
ncbi:MAG: TonB-dependent receptor [Gemmatimonadaceae bacterium]|nr:TonB-dependent receptor [Gemmatimonadaceae bacterium]